MLFFYKFSLKSLIFEKKSPKKGTLRKIIFVLRVPFFRFWAFFWFFLKKPKKICHFLPLLPLFYRLTSADNFVNETCYGNTVKRQKKGPKKFFLPLTTLILTFFKKLLVSTCFYTSIYVLINGLINVFFEILKFAKNRVVLE